MKLQLELNFESKKFDSLEEATIHAFHSTEKPLKHIAAELNLSPCGLSKRLNLTPSDDDPRLSLKNFERYIEFTGDFRPIYYLIEKFLQKDQDRLLQEFQEFKRNIPQLKKLIALAEGK
jgi:hypothetical protein